MKKCTIRQRTDDLDNIKFNIKTENRYKRDKVERDDGEEVIELSCETDGSMGCSDIGSRGESRVRKGSLDGSDSV